MLLIKHKNTLKFLFQHIFKIFTRTLLCLLADDNITSIDGTQNTPVPNSTRADKELSLRKQFIINIAAVNSSYCI